MNLLAQFNGDTHTKEALLDYIHEHINTTALLRMYEGSDVSHIKDAKALIDSSFDKLQEDFGIKVPPKPKVEHAR